MGAVFGNVVAHATHLIISKVDISGPRKAAARRNQQCCNREVQNQVLPRPRQKSSCEAIKEPRGKNAHTKRREIKNSLGDGKSNRKKEVGFGVSGLGAGATKYREIEFGPDFYI